jgi:hypothetical protein
MMEDLTRAVGAARDSAETFLEQQVHAAVVVLHDGVEGDQGVEHEDVDPSSPDLRLVLLERGVVERRRTVDHRGEPERVFTDGLDEQAVTAVSLGDPIALANGGDPSVDFVLVLFAVHAPHAEWRDALARQQDATASHRHRLDVAERGLGARAAGDGRADRLADVVPAEEELAPRDSRRIGPCEGLRNDERRRTVSLRSGS